VKRILVTYASKHGELSLMPFWTFSTGPVGENGPSSVQFEPRRV